MLRFKAISEILPHSLDCRKISKEALRIPKSLQEGKLDYNKGKRESVNDLTLIFCSGFLYKRLIEHRKHTLSVCTLMFDVKAFKFSRTFS